MENDLVIYRDVDWIVKMKKKNEWAKTRLNKLPVPRLPRGLEFPELKYKYTIIFQTCIITVKLSAKDNLLLLEQHHSKRWDTLVNRAFFQSLHLMKTFYI